MFKIISSFLIVFTISLQISAQCGGYFKESSRQVLSNPIAFGHFEDFDNDGKEDLLGHSPTLYVWSEGRKNYQFHFYKRVSANSFETTAQSTAIDNIPFLNAFIYGDVNGDGFKDLIVRHTGSPRTIKTYLNDGTGKFPTTAPTLTADETILAASDLNGDNKADLVVSNSTGLNYRLTQPDNSFGSPVFIASNASLEMGRHLFGIGYIWINSNPLIVEDINNDGHKDIAYVGQSGSWTYNLVVLTNNGSLSFTPSPAVVFGPVITKLRAYDLNNDGKKDFISDFGRNNGARIAVNNGDNTFTSSQLSLFESNANTYSQDYKTKNFSAADFDNDGDIDIIYPGRSGYMLFKNQGNATFNTQEIRGYPGIDQPANLDGDGKADTVFLNYSVINSSYRLWDGHNWDYYFLHSAVSFRKNFCDPVGQTKVIDFDGDGYVDRAFWNPQTGIWRYYPTFNNSNDSQVTMQLGSAALGDVPVPNDYDGDGKTDFAIYRTSNGTWWINGSRGTSISGFHFGLPEDKPVPADYDGDGRADIAVYRPSTGIWHFWLSQTNQYSAVHWGISDDKLVPADYDGDGKADVAVFRPSTQVWYILNSADNSIFITQWGLGTDIPVPGDYDGDGKANVTVYRDGLWYVLRSDYSLSAMYWGIANDVPFFNETLQSPSIGVYRSSNSTFHLGSQGAASGGYAQPTGNSANEIFVSSILPPQ